MRDQGGTRTSTAMRDEGPRRNEEGARGSTWSGMEDSYITANFFSKQIATANGDSFSEQSANAHGDFLPPEPLHATSSYVCMLRPATRAMHDQIASQTGDFHLPWSNRQWRWRDQCKSSMLMAFSSTC